MILIPTFLGIDPALAQAAIRQLKRDMVGQSANNNSVLSLVYFPSSSPASTYDIGEAALISPRRGSLMLGE